MSIRALLAADGIDEAALSPATKAGLAVCVVLVICIAGIMSGLTLGLVSGVEAKQTGNLMSMTFHDQQSEDPLHAWR